MSDENVEMVRRGYEAMRNRDLHAFLELWSVFPDWDPEVVSAREVADDVVLAHVRGRGRGVGSGVEVDINTWQILKVRDGRAFWMRGYNTETEALEAVGLRE